MSVPAAVRWIFSGASVSSVSILAIGAIMGTALVMSPTQVGECSVEYSG